MYIKKTYGCVLGKSSDSLLMKGLLDIYIPETHKSTLWKYWRATLDPKLCLDCLSHHGQIYAMDEIPDVEPPLHENCRCAIQPMEAITPDGATKDGENGADYRLINFGTLPDYYISKDELYALPNILRADCRRLTWKNELPLRLILLLVNMHRSFIKKCGQRWSGTTIRGRI